MKSVTRRFVLAAAVLGLAVGSAGRAEAGQVLYASFDNGTIERFDLATGQDLGPFASGLNSPQGLAFDASGNLYVANAGNNTIAKITEAGMVSTFASGIDSPRGLAFDASGNLYVSSNNGNFNGGSPDTISRITPGGLVSTFVSHQDPGVGVNLANPVGLAFDASGNLYVAASSFDRISRITPGGTVSIIAAGSGSGPDPIGFPTGLAFDKSGNLYSSNGPQAPYITKTTPGGTSSIFASGQGLGNSPFADLGLAFDASGKLYVARFTNSLTIDEITPDGTVSPFASGLSSSPRFLAIRDESPAAVPEPATLVQAVSGVALLGLVAWGRRLRAPA
ncbi:MAG TPA: hypothetical protein VKP69_33110 [Isosphaeraceae bacterium]|nr:hypothetical protein [Isosphaeraceae bacterium]